MLALLLVLPWLLLGTWAIAASYDTLAEDAWIHFRYARNLGEGLGLVSNPAGHTEEGYSSLSSILVLGVGQALGISLPFFERLIGILGTLGLILLLCRWLREIQGDRSDWLLLATGLGILASSDLAFWSTAGLPTTEYAWLLLLMAWWLWVTLQLPTRGRGLLLGALGFVCLNSRPEGVMYAPISFALSYGVQRFQGGSTRRWFTTMGPGLLLFLALTSALAIWKLAYFGDLLSNPSYVKLAVRPWMDPWAYFQRYFNEHGLLLLPLYVIALLFAAWQILRAICARNFDRLSLAVAVLAAFLAAQLFYIAYVRGDYMAGFRFFVPVHAFFVGLLLLLGIRITESVSALRYSQWRRGSFLLLFPILPLFLSCFSVPDGNLPIASGMIDKNGLAYYQEGHARLARQLEKRGGPYALSEFGYIAWHLRQVGIDLMGLNQHEIARCYKRYPLDEAVLAARDFVLSESPTVIATYGYWKDEEGSVHCQPNTAWFFLPYLNSPFFQNHYETNYPSARDDKLRLSLLRSVTKPVRSIDLMSGQDLDRLLHGFHVEPNKIWVGPIARILLDPAPEDHRIIIRGYQPGLEAYPSSRQRVRVAIDGDAVGDRILLDRDIREAGRFRFEIDLPADLRDRPHLLLSLFGRTKTHARGSADQRRLSWILEKINLLP